MPPFAARFNPTLAAQRLTRYAIWIVILREAKDLLFLALTRKQILHFAQDDIP